MHGWNTLTLQVSFLWQNNQDHPRKIGCLGTQRHREVVLAELGLVGGSCSVNMVYQFRLWSAIEMKSGRAMVHGKLDIRNN